MKALLEMYKPAILSGFAIIAFFTLMIFSATKSPQAVETAPTEQVQASTPTDTPTEQPEAISAELGAAIKAVELVQLWVDAGASETQAFEYTGLDGNTYQASYETDIQPLFTQNGVWFEGSQACSGCHFGNIETSYHEMDLATYQGLLKGGDVLSSPPGVPLFGQSETGATDYDFAHSKMRERLRNNRMPPGWEFDITETNRDGPCIQISADGLLVQEVDGKFEYGCDLNPVGLIEAWVENGAPESEAFAYGDQQVTFGLHVLPLFTKPAMWFPGSQACSSCHFGNIENSYHEMDLSTYGGILKGADVLSSPPGVPILGQSETGATDYDFAHSKLRERLRNNRMAPGVEFDITEENRDGPFVMAGKKIS